MHPCYRREGGATIETFPAAGTRLRHDRGASSSGWVRYAAAAASPRALDARQFVLLFTVLSGAMWLVSALGWWAGNAFAPCSRCCTAGAGGGAACLWRSGERQEEIRVVPAYVEVIPVPGGSPVFRAHPHWVRLLTDDERVRLASSGRQVEVGSFLAPAERQTLAETLEACSPPAMAATDDAKGLGNEAKQQVGHEVRERGCRSAGDRGLMPALAWARRPIRSRGS